MTDFDPRDRFDIPDDRELDDHIPSSVEDECPAGGEHTWITDDTGDAYPTVRYFVRCDECGAQPPKEDNPNV